MLGAIAEFETDLRRERQLEGIAKNGDAIVAALAVGEKPTAAAKRFNVARSTVYGVAAEA